MKERKEMFYLMTHSTHFIYGYMASRLNMNKYINKKPVSSVGYQGVVPQSDLNSTIIVSRCYNDLSMFSYD